MCYSFYTYNLYREEYGFTKMDLEVVYLLIIFGEETFI